MWFAQLLFTFCLLKSFGTLISSGFFKHSHKSLNRNYILSGFIYQSKHIHVHCAVNFSLLYLLRTEKVVLVSYLHCAIIDHLSCLKVLL